MSTTTTTIPSGHKYWLNILPASIIDCEILTTIDDMAPRYDYRGYYYGNGFPVHKFDLPKSCKVRIESIGPIFQSIKLFNRAGILTYSSPIATSTASSSL